MHKVASEGYFKVLLAAVDVDADRSGRGELRLDHEEEGNQNESYDNYCRYGSDDCVEHSLTSFFKVKYP